MQKLVFAAAAHFVHCNSSETPAFAVNPAVRVAAGGSDTTQDVMGDYLSTQNATTVTYNGHSYDVSTSNIPAFPASGVSVPGDTDCPTQTWTKDPLAPASNTTPTLGIAPFGLPGCCCGVAV